MLLGWPAERLDEPVATRVRHALRRPTAPAEPLPAPWAGHELYVTARALLRSWEAQELAAGTMDSVAADLVGAYVLGAIESGRGQAALEAARRRHQKDRAVLVRGLRRVDDLVR